MTDANQSASARRLYHGPAGAYYYHCVRAEAAQMGPATRKGSKNMKCSIEGCVGEYDRRKVVHTVRHRGEVVVIDHVPAEVCSVCGDVLFEPETVRHIEQLLGSREAPRKIAPLYEYS